MQKGVCVILVPLLLCISSLIILTLCSSLEVWNSVHLDFSNISGSVMASDMRGRRAKRLLQEHDGENFNSEEEMQGIHNGHNLCPTIGETGQATHQSKSMKSRNVAAFAVAEKNYTSEHLKKRFRTTRQNRVSMLNQSSSNNANLDGDNTATMDHLKRNTLSELVETNQLRGECSHAFGQASYQKSKEGLIVKYQDSGDNIHVCHYCNANFWSGEAIKQSSSNVSLIYTNCCKKGQIRLEQSKPAPYFLEKLLDPNNGSDSRLFRENIRIYNSMFSFTSMGATIDKNINNGSGPYIFKISGQIHHLMGSILPSDGECPKYAQLYIYDTKNEISNRINAIDPTHVNMNIKPDIVEGLIKMFNENNELVKEFRTIRDKFETHSLHSLSMTLLDRQPTDSKQYEQPVSEEIGGLIVGDIGEYNSNKDVIIESISGCLQRVSKIHPKYMSLQYPILFPYGEDGYKMNLPMQQVGGHCTQKKQNISMRAFITYHLQDRNNRLSTLLKGGRLFQQYLVDAYATVEESRLDWIRRNQKNIRSETFKDFMLQLQLELITVVI